MGVLKSEENLHPYWLGVFSFVFAFLVIFMGIEGCGVEKRESVWEEDIFSKVVSEFYFPPWSPGYFILAFRLHGLCEH